MNASSFSGESDSDRAAEPGGASFAYLGSEHIDSVLELELLTTSRPWSKEQYLKALDAGICVLAGYTGSSGLLAYASVALSPAADELEVYNLAVRPDMRRRGLARCLLGRLMEEARGHGLKRVVLEVRRGNLAARGLYVALGFEECGMRPKYYEDPVEDALIYAKTL